MCKMANAQLSPFGKPFRHSTLPFRHSQHATARAADSCFSNTKQVVSMATRTRLIAGLASLFLHTEMGFWLLQNNETTNVIRLGTCQCGKTTPLHKSDRLLE